MSRYDAKWWLNYKIYNNALVILVTNDQPTPSLKFKSLSNLAVDYVMPCLSPYLLT